MPTPQYRLRVFRRVKKRTAMQAIQYIERGGDLADRADDVLALGRSGPDLRDWQCVDRAEVHCRACVARVLEIAIPYQLSIDQVRA